jgi:CBS domain-containing protein
MTYVRQLLQGKPAEVWHVGPRDMAFKALELMAEKNIGALPVVDAENGGRLLGMFSERDYARKVILKGKSSQATTVSELMSSPVTTVALDDTIETCMELMTTRHIRHLPVIDHGQMIGLVSIGDVLNALVREQRVLINDLENYIVGARS